jgi:hypothetical protein
MGAVAAQSNVSGFAAQHAADTIGFKNPLSSLSKWSIIARPF